MYRIFNTLMIMFLMLLMAGCSEIEPQPKVESVTQTSVKQVSESKPQTESEQKARSERDSTPKTESVPKAEPKSEGVSKPKKVTKPKVLPDPLKVGMAVHYPPLAFKFKGKLQGIEVDFAHALAKELGRPIQIIVLPWTQLPQALETKVVDIVMAGSSITKDREKYVLFSEPYMKVSQMAVMRLGVNTPNPFTKGKGMKIGFSDFTTGEKFVKEAFPLAEQKGFTKLEHGIVAVLNGEVDYFFHDSPSIWYYTATHSLEDLVGWYVPYTDENLAWGFDRKNIAFKKKVDGILQKWQNNGTVQRIIHKWIPVTINTPQGNDPLRF